MMKKSLAAVLGALLMAGAANAQVQVAPGGKGDVLIAPLFMTGGGWSTELKVINTNLVDSAVAKVVFHAPGRSEEVLDFLIFLSPGDVWTGNIVTNADGSVGVQSDDPSSLVVNLAGGCPSATAASVGFVPTVARFTRPLTTGYVTVFETRMHRQGTAPNLGAAPVAKAAILAAYSAACNAGTPITADLTDNVLVGISTLRNPTNGNVLQQDMMALQDYNNTTYHSVGALTGFFNNAALSTKQQVEDALWSSAFTIPFNVTPGNFTFGVVTFPTKETYALSANSQYTPFFPAVNDAVNDIGTQVPVTFEVRDEEENRLGIVGCQFSPCPVVPGNTLPREVNIIQMVAGTAANTGVAPNPLQVGTAAFTRGWVNLSIAAVPSTVRSAVNYNNFGIAGAPAVVSYIQWNINGNQLQGNLAYAAKSQSPAAR